MVCKSKIKAQLSYHEGTREEHSVLIKKSYQSTSEFHYPTISSDDGRYHHGDASFVKKSKLESSITRTYSTIQLFLLSLILLSGYLTFNLTGGTLPSLSSEPKPNSVYVPGAGFSGFWYTLGRLQSIPNPREKNYYCFSAGCLGVVATTINNSTMEDIYDIAHDAQKRWKEGKVSRYDVVEYFVDRLLPSDIIEGEEIDNALDKINILTTMKGVGTTTRKAKTIRDLREMLIQTTWIPFATGWGWWKMGSDERLHMDGGLTALFHPRCEHHLTLPLMMDIFFNIVNVNLGKDKVEKFYNSGLSNGL